MVGEQKSSSLRTEVVERVPPEEVGKLTQDFRDAGAVEVRAEAEPEGTWRIIATFRPW
jgi:hypothetical protein